MLSIPDSVLVLHLPNILTVKYRPACRQIYIHMFLDHEPIIPLAFFTRQTSDLISTIETDSLMDFVHVTFSVVDGTLAF